MKEALERIANEELSQLGYELVDLRIGGSNGRPVLDLRIDRLDQQKVQVEDCVKASRAIEARLDAQPDLITSRYVLEVSSPGMERPLRNVAEWKRFVGKQVSVNVRGVAGAFSGRHEMEIVAVTEEGGGAVITLKDQKGVERNIALADVVDARLVFNLKL